MKWCKARIKYVTAFDPDKKALYEKQEFDGAIKRYSTMKSIPNMPKYFFGIFLTDPNLLNIINQRTITRFMILFLVILHFITSLKI